MAAQTLSSEVADRGSEPDMPDDTWTVASLKEYLEQRLDTLEEHVEQRFDEAEKAVTLGLAAAEKAVGKAEGAAERRFESVNEFRAQLSDQAATFLTREAYTAAHEALQLQVASLEARVNLNTGKAMGMNALWGWLVGAAGLGAAIVSLAIR